MTDDHHCKHEVDLALMSRTLRENTEITRESHMLLQNIVTRVSLVEQSDKRQWWFLGAVSLSILGAAIGIVVKFGIV